MCSLVAHDRLHAVRQLVDGGVDLRRRGYRLPSHVGGGLGSMFEANLEAYIWLNQLLVLGDIPWHLFRYGWTLKGWTVADGLSESDPKTVRQLAALRALHELCAAYDNREYRDSAHVQALRRSVEERTLTLDALREHLKDHIFPELYRISHVMLYNQLVHGNGGAARSGGAAAQAALEDPKAPDADRLERFAYRLSAPHDGPVEASVYGIIGAALRKAVPPVEGLKRDQLFASHRPPGWRWPR